MQTGAERGAKQKRREDLALKSAKELQKESKRAQRRPKGFKNEARDAKVTKKRKCKNLMECFIFR